MDWCREGPHHVSPLPCELSLTSKPADSPRRGRYEIGPRCPATHVVIRARYRAETPQSPSTGGYKILRYTRRGLLHRRSVQRYG